MSEHSLNKYIQYVVYLSVFDHERKSAEHRLFTNGETGFKISTYSAELKMRLN